MQKEERGPGMRRTVQKILFLSALVLLGGVLAFQWTHSDTCLGLRFLEDIPDDCQYVYRDYSDVLWFYDQKAAVDVLHLKPGDNILLTGGPINGQHGNTNTIKIETI